MGIARNGLPWYVAAAMSLRWTVREVAEKDGITSARDLARRSNLHFESVRRIWNDTARRVDLDTIEALCDTLGVRPGQLFQYSPEPDGVQRRRRRRRTNQ